MSSVLDRLTGGVGLDSRDILSVTREKFQKAVAETKPLFAWFSLTEECNLHCRYCFADSSRPLKDELSTREVLAIIDNIVEAGTRAIVFGGGEPTLREDLLTIVEYSSRYMTVALNTNGQVLDQRYIERLARSGLSQIKISVDGLRDTHDWNRGKGSFDRAIESLRLCRSAGIPTVILIATVSRLNHQELPELVRLAMELGVDFSMVEFLPLGRGMREWGLTPEQTREVQRFLMEARRLYGPKRIIFENRYIITEDEHAQRICMDPQKPVNVFDFCVGCPNGIYQYCINARGRLTAGDITTLEIADLRKERLSKVWQESETLQLLRDRDRLKGRCGSCEYRYICGGCRRRAYALTGDLLAEDPGCWRR